MQFSQIFSVQGRIALITGAATGLGEHFAEVLAENGAKVVLVGRRETALQAIATRIQSHGGQAIIALADVNDQKAMETAFDLAEKQFGVVDILINNAGIAPAAKFIEMDEVHWRSVMATNLDSVIFTAQLAAKRMIKANITGNIINIASILGFGVQKAVSAYAITKAGVIQATRSMGLELARRNVRVNAIAPGYIVTNINRDFLNGPEGEKMLKSLPIGRFGTPADLDGALLLLASDAARFMIGETVVVDGGHKIILAS